MEKACSLPSCSAKVAFVCGNCKVARYCSQEHQKQHWKKHKSNCTAPAASTSKSSSSSSSSGSSSSSSHHVGPFPPGSKAPSTSSSSTQLWSSEPSDEMGLASGIGFVLESEEVWEDGSRLTPVGMKPGGVIVGAIYQLCEEGLWIGKLGFNEDDVDQTTEAKTTVRQGTIRNAIKEKIAADFYLAMALSLPHSYWIPRYRLASLPILNDFTRNSDLAIALVEEIGGGTQEVSSIHVLSEMVDGYHDLKDAKVKHNERLMLMYEFIKETGAVPEKIWFNNEELPLVGLVELLAVSRLLGDVDVLGNSGTNTGFVVLGTKIAQCVKVDTGLSFSFDSVLNRLYAKQDSSRALQDLRDIQIGPGTAIVVKWTALTAEQQYRFRSTLHTGLELLEDEKLLTHLIMRDNMWNRFEPIFTAEHFKKSRQGIIDNVELLSRVYAEELKLVFSRRAQLDFVSRLLTITEEFILCAKKKLAKFMKSEAPIPLEYFKNDLLLGFLNSEESRIPHALHRDLCELEVKLTDGSHLLKENEPKKASIQKILVLLRNFESFISIHTELSKWLPRTENGKLVGSEVVDLFVLGPTNAGKSTLINALLGNTLCYVDSSAATSHCTKFVHTLEDIFVIEDQDGVQLTRCKKLKEVQDWLQVNEQEPKGKDFVVKVPQTASKTLGICTITDCPGFSEKRFFPMFLDKSNKLSVETLMVCVFSLLESFKNGIQEDALEHLKHLGLFRVVFVLTNVHVYADRTKKALRGRNLTAEQILEETTNKIRTEFINPLQKDFPQAHIEIVDINEDRKVVWDKVMDKLVAETTVQTEQQQVGGLVALVERERLRRRQAPLDALKTICEELYDECLVLYDQDSAQQELTRYSSFLSTLVQTTVDKYEKDLNDFVQLTLTEMLEKWDPSLEQALTEKMSSNSKFDEGAVRYLIKAVEPLFFSLQLKTWKVFCARVESSNTPQKLRQDETLPKFKRSVSWSLATKIVPTTLLVIPAFLAISIGPGGVYWAAERRKVIGSFILEHCRSSKSPRVISLKRFLVETARELLHQKRLGLQDKGRFEIWANQYKGPLQQFYTHQLVLTKYKMSEKEKAEDTRKSPEASSSSGGQVKAASSA